jgi:hypothetical protein
MIADGERGHLFCDGLFIEALDGCSAIEQGKLRVDMEV